MYDRNKVLEEIKINLKIRDRVVMFFFKEYTYIIYKIGTIKGFNR